jgi:arsenate reductase
MKHPLNEITLYYNPDSLVSQKTLAYAHSICPNVREINHLEQLFTERQLGELVNDLKLKPADLVDRNHELFADKYANQDFSDADWLTVLVKTPQLMISPIAIMGEKIMIIHNPVDILQLTDTPH